MFLWIGLQHLRLHCFVRCTISLHCAKKTRNSLAEFCLHFRWSPEDRDVRLFSTKLPEGPERILALGVWWSTCSLLSVDFTGQLHYSFWSTSWLEIRSKVAQICVVSPQSHATLSSLQKGSWNLSPGEVNNQLESCATGIVTTVLPVWSSQMFHTYIWNRPRQTHRSVQKQVFRRVSKLQTLSGTWGYLFPSGGTVDSVSPDFHTWKIVVNKTSNDQTKSPADFQSLSTQVWIWVS